jgi:hypothetical protein
MQWMSTVPVAKLCPLVHITTPLGVSRCITKEVGSDRRIGNVVPERKEQSAKALLLLPAIKVSNVHIGAIFLAMFALYLLVIMSFILSLFIDTLPLSDRSRLVVPTAAVEN